MARTVTGGSHYAHLRGDVRSWHCATAAAGMHQLTHATLIWRCRSRHPAIPGGNQRGAALQGEEAPGGTARGARMQCTAVVPKGYRLQHVVWVQSKSLLCARPAACGQFCKAIDVIGPTSAPGHALAHHPPSHLVRLGACAGPRRPICARDQGRARAHQRQGADGARDGTTPLVHGAAHLKPLLERCDTVKPALLPFVRFARMTSRHTAWYPCPRPCAVRVCTNVFYITSIIGRADGGGDA